MTTDDVIRPFAIDVRQADLADLAERLVRTRWAAELPGEPWARGVPTAYLRELATYWLDEDQLVEAQYCGRAAGVTTAVIAGTLVRGLSP